MSYNSDRTSSDPDVSDPASGSFFGADFKKHDDLKSMLDSPKDNLKLEAMKRIVTSMASGRDVSDLFAAVVKNVASKNIEIKKLVYVYLVRYAEEQQDLALLSISTFQKGMKDPNQLIRASALRVLSSIRVPVIAPIMMLAIKEAVMDMSPFVRKTAAHAIPKLYSLDPEEKDQLVEVIEKLLKDKTTLVAGSAVMAFEEVCPDRIDLIHKNFRKLCTLLVDIDEWGQVAVIHMLTRYARTQFLDPNKEELQTAEFYPSENNDTDSNTDNDDNEAEKTPKKKPYVMDPDHRLLLRTCLPLLLSRNSSVVMGVARLYHHTAPAGEMGVITKALVRLLRSHREVQTVVLSNIATMSTTRKGAFEPYLKSFFVHSNDPTHIRLLKLEIMTNIVSETSISTVLREFQTYITSSDKQFVANTIQAIGRCASNISEVTDTCLSGLVRLLSNRDELVVAESVVVIKKLLQLKAKDKSDIISHMGRLVDSIKVPMARASILWLLGEYSERVPKIAPDVLRKMAKSFTSEEDIVKLQILNLGAKLCLSNAKQSKLLFQYVLNVAKYDMNYDIRDRARFLRQLILPAGEKASQMTKQAKKLCLAAKPPPVIESIFKDRESYQLGSLSHMINAKAQGYQALPEWPEIQPDPSVRNVEVESSWDSSSVTKKKGKKVSKNKKSTFYSSSEESEASHSGSDSDSGSGSEGEEDSESGSESKSESGSDDESGSDTDKGNESESDSDKGNANGHYASDSDIEEIKSGSHSETASEKSQSHDGSDESDEESEESGSESESSVEENTNKSSPEKKKETSKTKSSEPKSKPPKEAKPVQTLDQLLILDDGDGSSTSFSIPAHAPASAILSPSLAQEMESLSIGNPNSPPLVTVSTSFFPSKSYELLHRVTGGGLCAEYKFTRSPCIYSTKMVAVEISLTNTSGSTITNIHVGQKRLSGGVSMEDFQEVASLPHGGRVSVSVGINFNDTTQPANFELCTKDKKYNVSIKAPVGELLYSYTMSEKDFTTLQGKLKGMNESSSKVSIPPESCEEKEILTKVSEAANVARVTCKSGQVYRFAGKTLSSDLPVLLTISLGENLKENRVTVNCEKMVITSMLLKELKEVLGR